MAPPNIILILADDLGWGDLTTYNPESRLSTPRLDRLAAQGLRFTDAHAASAICTPSRYNLLTGRYPWRSRLPTGLVGRYGPSLLEPGGTTLPSFLRTQGYHTAVIGKWHLGLDWCPRPGCESILQAAPEPGCRLLRDLDPAFLDFSRPPRGGPLDHGFEESFILPNSLDQPPYGFLQNDSLLAPFTALTPGQNPENGFTGPFWRPGLMAPGFDFSAVLPTLGDRADSFLRARATAPAQPFFLYLPLTAPHTPWLPGLAYLGRTSTGAYGDFVAQFDALVGSLLDTLDHLSLASQTLVLCSSDHGPYWHPGLISRFGHRSAAHFRGMKGDLYEGGHRVPLLARWPEVIPPGSVSSQLVCLGDILATCAGLLGVPLPPGAGEDSHSFLPALLGNQESGPPPRTELVHHSAFGHFALRRHHWKLLERPGSGGFTEPVTSAPGSALFPSQLFDLAQDPSESRDLALAFPALARELLTALRQTTGRPWDSAACL